MDRFIKGKVFVLGDNVDTDQIIPAEYLVYSLTSKEESENYGKYALSAVPLEVCGLPYGNIPFVKCGNKSEYEIIIAGSNFGCGSSREHAPFALNKAGIKMIIAESYARIFYRNSVDGGFFIPYECNNKLNAKIKTGNVVEVDTDTNIIKVIDTDEEFNLKELGSVLPIVKAGGIFKYARINNMIK
ncbi:MAG TPA: 3-isopropylmalate dehydratase [Melioribacteraceae bacterium]|nr:3-isopropylmalate dehydratase [Melioribacteraceae bacterium]